LIFRRNKYGYALGIARGAFRLWTRGFLTTFIRNGFEPLASLLGHRLRELTSMPTGTFGILLAEEGRLRLHSST
jgi:hypothetical protein